MKKRCNKQKAPYTCPKCQVPYCGLKCYQSAQHEKCSEQFYEANVLEELQQQSASEDEKRAMLELLKQFEDGCAEDEHEIREGEAAAQLADRLQDVDLDGDPQKIWEKLSKQERDEFQQLVKEQKFTDIVHEWLPWWTYKRAKKPLVSEISPDAPEQQEDLSEYNFPEISTSTKPFSDLCKTGPSDCLRFNTINVMLAYTYMVMRYNGEHHDMCVQCAEDFVSLSQVLLKADNCKSGSEAIRNFCASLKLLDDLFISMDYVMEVIENLLMVLHGPDKEFSNDFILMAFSDVIKLIENARKQLKSDPEAVDGRKKLVLMKKKLEYYSSYVLSHSDDHVPGLIPEILTVKEKLLDEMTSHRQTEKIQKKEKERLTAEKKPKIVELS